MGKVKKMVLGTFAGLGLLSALLGVLDSIPSSPSNTRVERPRGSISSGGYFNALHLTVPLRYGDEWKSCDHYFILSDLTRVLGQGWDSVEGEVHLQLDLNCKRRPDWNGNTLPLGAFGYDPKDKDYLIAIAKSVVRWEGGNKREFSAYFDSSRGKIINPREEDIIPASASKFRISVPTVAKDVALDVEFFARPSYNDPIDQGFYPGFSRKTPLPKNGDYVDWRRAETQIENWLNEKSNIVKNGRVPIVKVSQNAYEEWFAQKIAGIMIGNIERYRDPAITSLKMIPTNRGLEINVAFTNPTLGNSLDLPEAGFYARYVLDSTGKVLKRYDSLKFPLKASTDRIAPQYSTDGSILIRPYHSFPKNARYLLGSIKFGQYGGILLHHDPVIVDITTIGYEQFEGRLGLRGLFLRIRDYISENFNRLQ